MAARPSRPQRHCSGAYSLQVPLVDQNIQGAPAHSPGAKAGVQGSVATTASAPGPRPSRLARQASGSGRQAVAVRAKHVGAGRGGHGQGRGGHLGHSSMTRYRSEPWEHRPRSCTMLSCEPAGWRIRGLVWVVPPGQNPSLWSCNKPSERRDKRSEGGGNKAEPATGLRAGSSQAP